MEAGALLARLRTRVDDVAEPYLYPDADGYAALNDAVRQASIRKRLLFDMRTVACCLPTVAAGQSAVRLHPRVLAIRTARWSGSDRPLTLTTLKRLDRERPMWPSDPAGVPTHLVVDAQTGEVTLYPTPALAGTLQFAVWRAPLEAEELEGPSDEPVIDETFHEDLLDWAEHKLFGTKDGEAGDAKRAAEAAARFEAKFGRLPDAREIARWGLSPRRGQRAEFD